MTNSLFRLLKTFTIEEFSELGEYVSKPSVNNRRVLTGLYNLLADNYPDFEEEVLSNRKIHAKLFPGKRFNDSAVRPLLHYLKELAVEFIAIRDFRNSPFQIESAKAYALIQRNDTGMAQKIISKATAIISERVDTSSSYYHRYLLRNYENIRAATASRSSSYANALKQISVNEAFDYLTDFYLLRTVQMFLNILNMNKLYDAGVDTSPYEAVIKKAELQRLTTKPLIHVYYLLTKLIKDNSDVSSYNQVRSILEKNADSFSASDLTEIYINLENFCNARILDGDENYRKEKFEICREEISSGIYKAGGIVSPVFIKSVVSLALWLGEIKWAKDFLSSHIKDASEYPGLKNSISFSLASCEFEEGNFGKALELLSSLGYDDVYMKADAKILQIMSHFETGSPETVQYQLDSFKVFLRGDKLIPSARKGMYESFMNYFRKLNGLKETGDKGGLLQLAGKIESDSSVSRKKWLLDKINKLLRNIK